MAEGQRTIIGCNFQHKQIQRPKTATVNKWKKAVSLKLVQNYLQILFQHEIKLFILKILHWQWEDMLPYI